MWKNLVGNGILDRNELCEKIGTNLVCLQCIHDQLAGTQNGGPVVLDDARLLVATKNFGFACTLSVTCKHGKHHFTIEHARVPPDTQAPANQMPTNINNNNGSSVTESTTNTEPSSSNNASSSTNGNSSTEKNNVLEKKQRGRPVNFSKIEDYEINHQAYLMMELFGNGLSSLDTMLGMLGIAVHSGLCSSWAAISHHLGVAQQAVADNVQIMNLEKEIEAMKECGIKQVQDKDNMVWPLTCTYDMGWQKRASGKNYNSQSGHGFMVGGYTSKILKRVCYSRGCKTCANQWRKQNISRTEATKDELTGEVVPNNTTHHCPRNYNGSAKSMEACGAVSMMTALYDDGGKYVSVLVGDDDSTTRSHSQHSYKAIMEQNGWTDKAAHWPKKGKNMLRTMESCHCVSRR